MSDWEQYVEPAAKAAYESGAPVWPWESLSEAEREPRLRRMRGALSTVCPGIVEDTKHRLVEAAARAIERGSNVAPLGTEYGWQAPCSTVWGWCADKDHLVNQLERLGGRGRMRLVGDWDEFPDIEATP